jgi:ceramide glucosyltransferase
VISLLLAGLCLLSLALTLWQWGAARRFPLHQRNQVPTGLPGVSVLKPLRGTDAETRACLESWLVQDYPGPVQVLFGVASADDPAAAAVTDLRAAHPAADATLVVCPEALGTNAKMATLAQLERHARHGVIVISDADVRVPPDLLANLIPPLEHPHTGLVHCFYRLSNPVTTAMRCEAVATNADFWTQVLQAASLRPTNFALGAVMATTRGQVEAIGGLASLADYLADDFQLGNRIARSGAGIALCPVVVECREARQGWREVGHHQLRWARTIRACRPVLYFLSILSNATLWPLLWLAWEATRATTPVRIDTPPADGGLVFVLSVGGGLLPCAAIVVGCLLVRIATALQHQSRLAQAPWDPASWWLVPVKDLLQAAIWLGAFLGRRVTWRGRRYRVLRNGRLVRAD